MDERERDREPMVERHTTVVTTGSDRGRGSGAILALVALLVIGVLAYLLLSGTLGGDKDVNVDVDLPKVETPDVDLPKVTNGS